MRFFSFVQEVGRLPDNDYFGQHGDKIHLQKCGWNFGYAKKIIIEGSTYIVHTVVIKSQTTHARKMNIRKEISSAHAQCCSEEREECPTTTRKYFFIH